MDCRPTQQGGRQHISRYPVRRHDTSEFHFNLREAVARADHTNARQKHDGLPSIDFGAALHVGTVIYGKVGTEKRLDFTATGPAAEMVCRCEAMTRDLNTPILAIAAFAAECPEPEQPQGSFEIRGFSAPAEWVAHPLTTN